jgi:hypothetical protein
MYAREKRRKEGEEKERKIGKQEKEAKNVLIIFSYSGKQKFTRGRKERTRGKNKKGKEELIIFPIVGNKKIHTLQPIYNGAYIHARCAFYHHCGYDFVYSRPPNISFLIFDLLIF